MGTPSAAIVNKKIAEQAGLFKLNYEIVEDLGFFMEVSQLTNFVLINDVLLYKRLHEKNASSQKIQMYRNHKRLLMDILANNRPYISSHRLSGDSARALARLNYWLGTLYFEAGDKKKAFSLYGEGLRSTWRLSNILRFLWVCSKKILRMLTFDRLSRKNLGINAKKRSF